MPYAAERIAIPVTKARLAAYLTNTVEAWNRFMDVWPTESCDTEAAIRRLILLRHESFCLVGGNLRAQQGHRGRARASATISR